MKIANGSLWGIFKLDIIHIRDFPGGPVGKTLHSQCRGPGVNPWSGN